MKKKAVLMGKNKTQTKFFVQKSIALLLMLSLLTVPVSAEVDNPYSEDVQDLTPQWATEIQMPQSLFHDVDPEADYAEAVYLLSELGIVVGDGAGNFNPDNTISRAETAVILCRLMGVEDEAKAMQVAIFDDVAATHWAAGYVAKAVELGIIRGYGNGHFGPTDPVTYEQIVKMLVCAWGYEGEALAKGGWPKGYVAVAAEIGIIDDTNTVTDTQAPVVRWRVALLANNAVMLPTSYVGGSINEKG